MDSKDWEILKTVAEEKNITKAAERLYTSQPALTYRLKNMEKEFNARILIRTSSGILLTSQGEQLLEYANDMLRKMMNIKDRICNTAGKVHGSLRLGASSSFSHYQLPSLLEKFIALYPDVEISLKTGLSSKVHRMLQQEEIMAAIIRGDSNWQEEQYLLSEEPICLVSLHPLKLTDLPSRPRIDFKTDYSLQNIVETWWRENFYRPPLINMFVDNIDTCRQLVLRNLGWAIFPGIGLKEHDNLYVRPLHFKSGEPLTRRTWLVCRTSSLELSVVRAFVDHVRSYTKTSLLK
ncbi:MAG: LysR family transcriptional regulator [Veillonellales bacterium]